MKILVAVKQVAFLDDEFEMRDDGTADEASRRELLFVEQPYGNHNGGHVIFGPDGMLWIGMGDGGSAGDPHGNAQDRGSLLGKMLRLDVDRDGHVDLVDTGGADWKIYFDDGAGTFTTDFDEMEDALEGDVNWW